MYTKLSRSGRSEEECSVWDVWVTTKNNMMGQIFFENYLSDSVLFNMLVKYGKDYFLEKMKWGKENTYSRNPSIFLFNT